MTWKSLEELGHDIWSIDLKLILPNQTSWRSQNRSVCQSQELVGTCLNSLNWRHEEISDQYTNSILTCCSSWEYNGKLLHCFEVGVCLDPILFPKRCATCCHCRLIRDSIVWQVVFEKTMLYSKLYTNYNLILPTVVSISISCISKRNMLVLISSALASGSSFTPFPASSSAVWHPCHGAQVIPTWQKKASKNSWVVSKKHQKQMF